MCREVSSSSLSNLFSIPGTHSYQILSLPTICQSFPFYHFLLIWKIQVFCVCVWEIKSLIFFFLKEFLLFFRINLPCKTKQYSCSLKGITYPFMATQIILSGFTPNWNLILQGSVWDPWVPWDYPSFFFSLKLWHLLIDLAYIWLDGYGWILGCPSYNPW